MVWREDIVNQNLWWKHKEKFASYDRDLKKLRKGLITFERKSIDFERGGIYTVRGPRRVGKTALVKQTIERLIRDNKVNPEQIFYFNCETLPSRSKNQLKRTIDIFLEKAAEYDTCYIFLDEITYVTDWQIELKNLHDIGLLSNAVTVVTGSSSHDIKKGTEYMPGRGIEGNEYLLKPLSFREFVLQISHNEQVRNLITENPEKRDSLKNLVGELNSITITLEENKKELKEIFHKIYPFTEELKLLFNIYLLTGGFPQVINNYLKNIDEGIKKGKRGNKNIEDSMYEELMRYIGGEIRKVDKKEEIARQILRATLRRICSGFSYTTLSKEIEDGIQHQTLLSYIDVMEKSFILQSLHSYDFNKKMERVKGNKKLYFSDPFILHAVNSVVSGKTGFDLAREYLEKENNIAGLVQCILASHLTRIKEIPKMREPITFLWFYYDRNKEIDFVYRTNENYLGLEVKYQYGAREGDIKKINQIKEYILLTQDSFDMTQELIVPVHIFLPLLELSERNL